MAEWLNAAVLKTDLGDEPSGGSNPSLAANYRGQAAWSRR